MYDSNFFLNLVCLCELVVRQALHGGYRAEDCVAGTPGESHHELCAPSKDEGAAPVLRRSRGESEEAVTMKITTTLADESVQKAPPPPWFIQTLLIVKKERINSAVSVFVRSVVPRCKLKTWFLLCA